MVNGEGFTAKFSEINAKVPFSYFFTITKNIVDRFTRRERSLLPRPAALPVPNDKSMHMEQTTGINQYTTEQVDSYE